MLLPTGDVVIKDEFDTGAENYKEFFWGLVGLSGEGQNFDGNGMYVRFQPGGGSQAVSLGTAGSGRGQVFGNNVAVPLGNRPFYPGKRPPYRPERALPHAASSRTSTGRRRPRPRRPRPRRSRARRHEVAIRKHMPGLRWRSSG